MGYPSSLPPPPLGFEIFKSLYLSHFWPDQSFPHTLPFRWTQVKKKGPLQTPKPLIFFLFPISENVDVEILQRGNFEKKLFLRFVMGLFSPGPEVFSRYLWNGRSTLKIEENKMHFFFDFGSRWVLPKFSGAPWDPLGPFLDPLGPP